MMQGAIPKVEIDEVLVWQPAALVIPEDSFAPLKAF